jgi:hypothetical protein
MSKEKVHMYNVAKFVKRDSDSAKEVEDRNAEAKEKVAIALGMQLLKRDLISFDTEEAPGPNAGERRIIIKGSVLVNKKEL